ncbi:hypothetical protein [Streptomyces sp. PBH53]|uniref:hypothetical protein n=1 Tax=Streptomyces sp. PBH53 TaxID=1577075 RepID=UPI001AD828D6|nr:hypothetical protein [Streptomyces sp. PBH53]
MGELWNAITSDFGTGLIGALIGGGFTLLGTWLQSRKGDAAAHLAQTRATAQRGVEAATTLAITIQRQTYREHGTFEDREGWGRELMAHQSNLTALLGLLPDDQRETRERVLDLLNGVQHWDGREVWEEYRIRTTIFLGEMAAWLVALARGSEPPEHQDMNRIAAERILDHRQGSLEDERESLVIRAEMYELGQEEHERVREIDAALEAIRQERSALAQNQVNQVQIAP